MYFGAHNVINILARKSGKEKIEGTGVNILSKKKQGRVMANGKPSLEAKRRSGLGRRWWAT